MKPGLYFALFGNKGMEPEMQLGLHFSLFENEGMEPEMKPGLYSSLIGNEGMEPEMKHNLLSSLSCLKQSWFKRNVVSTENQSWVFPAPISPSSSWYVACSDPLYNSLNWYPSFQPENNEGNRFRIVKTPVMIALDQPCQDVYHKKNGLNHNTPANNLDQQESQS